ncbi:hypothetical protein ACN47E_004419 [Coniothyrium glycines]
MAVLSKIVLSAVGSLPSDNHQIKRWVEANGGTWSTSVKQGVTHLLSSEAAYKNNRAIQVAKDLEIWILTYDWFEDSLHKGRKLSEKKYTWESIKLEKKKRKQLKRMGEVADGTLTKPKRKSRGFFFGTASEGPATPFVSATEDLQRRRAERGAAPEIGHGTALGSAQDLAEVEAASHDHGLQTPRPSASSPRLVQSPDNSPCSSSKPALTSSPSSTQAKNFSIKDLYHYFLDQTGFEYKIVLVRSEPSTNSFARYHLALLESHTKPPTYCTLVQYTPPALPASRLDSLASRSTDMQTALQTFLRANASQPPSPKQPSPTPPEPFKLLICPMSSPYDLAFRAFRHAFRDITLLSWEERFDTDKTLQTSRAKLLNIEPFVYKRPSQGLPMGILPQIVGMGQGGMDSAVCRGDAEEGYVRDRWGLPGLQEVLGTGTIGGRVVREKKEEEKRREEELEIEDKGKGKGKSKGRRVNYNKPFYNGVQGRPKTQA